MKPQIIARLESTEDEFPYLKIHMGNNRYSNGGNQSWWGSKMQIKEDDKRSQLKKTLADSFYRMQENGCGVIALCDMEIYMAPGNKKTWEMKDYMDYVEEKYKNRYRLGKNAIDCTIGLNPFKMIAGLKKFFAENKYQKCRFKWAPFWVQGKKKQRESVLEKITEMLTAGTPVVFASHSFKKGGGVSLYPSAEAFLQKKAEQKPNGHYMTIIGLMKMEELSDNYVLEVISWGRRYLVDFEEFANGLTYFQNILGVFL